MLSFDFRRVNRVVPALLLAGSAAATHAAGLPNSAELQYRGSYRIPASMSFNRSGNSYSVNARISVPLYALQYRSSGIISGSTLKPQTFTESHRGEPYAQARFSGDTISYGKPGGQVKVATPHAPVFDFFTLGWQLAATDGKLAPNTHVTNGRAIYAISSVRNLGSSTFTLGGESTPVTRYRVQRGSDSMEYLLAPAYNNIPVQIVYDIEGKNYTLNLTSAKIDGKQIEVD